MTLPKIVLPSEKLKLPYSGETVKVRPFSVGTEKSMLLARETSAKALAEFIGELLEEHVDGLTRPIMEYPAYEVDYMFSALRIISAGSKVDMTVTCPECGHKHDVVITIDPRVEKNPPKTLTMAVPTTDGDTILEFVPAPYSAVTMLAGEDPSIPRLLWTMLKSVTTPEETVTKESLREDEFVEWAGDIPAKTVQDFVATSPWKVDYGTVDVTCEGCGHEISMEMTNVIDFFT